MSDTQEGSTNGAARSPWEGVAPVLGLIAAAAAVVVGAGYVEEMYYGQACLQLAFPNGWPAPVMEIPRYWAALHGIEYMTFAAGPGAAIFGLALGVGRLWARSFGAASSGRSSAPGWLAALLVAVLAFLLTRLPVDIALSRFHAEYPANSVLPFMRWGADRAWLCLSGAGAAMAVVGVYVWSAWEVRRDLGPRHGAWAWPTGCAALYAASVFLWVPNDLGVLEAGGHLFPMVTIEVAGSPASSRDSLPIQGYLVAETRDAWVVRKVGGAGCILSKSAVARVDLGPGPAALGAEIASATDGSPPPGAAPDPAGGRRGKP
jgi:hypothetical protein